MANNTKWQKKGTPKKGNYIPTNPEKVILVENDQNRGSIIYRSSWERIFMHWCDVTESVIKWASEPFPIPYIKPTDFREHRYYIDFYFEAKSSNGYTKKYLIEIKPKHETLPPKPPKRKTEKSMENFQKRITTYQVNQAKWDSARKFANMNNMEFKIITEDELGL
jgi:hypothetical protein